MTEDERDAEIARVGGQRGGLRGGRGYPMPDTVEDLKARSDRAHANDSGWRWFTYGHPWLATIIVGLLFAVLVAGVLLVPFPA